MREASPELEAISPVRSRSQTAFQRQLLLFLLPVLILVGLAEASLWKIGETWSIERVLRHQERRPGTLFMRGILDQSFYRYKSAGIQRNAPRILAVGSSRVMKFRREMFGAQGAHFYNAGGIIQNLEDLRTWVQSLPERNGPEIVLLGVDLWWFNDNRASPRGLAEGALKDPAGDWQEHVRAWRTMKRKRMLRRVLHALATENAHVGISAKLQGRGFRLDGSMEDNLPLPSNEEAWRFLDRERPPVPERIRSGSSPFEPPGNGLSGERLQLLEQCLEEMRQRGILVLGFLPPFSSEAAALLERSEIHGRLWSEFRKRVPRVFAKQDFPCQDVSTPGQMGLDDRYLSDGLHAQETFHLYLLQEFLENERVAQAFPGLKARLQLTLASDVTNFWYPDYAAMANWENVSTAFLRRAAEGGNEQH